MVEEIKDGTKVDVTGTKTDVSDKTTSTQDKDPKLEAALEAKEKLDDLLETHGYDSLEDLSTAIQKSNDVATKLGKADLAEILEKASTLDKYNEYWAAEEISKKKTEEEPDESITRLEREIKALKSSKEKEDSDNKALEEASKAVKDFNLEVTSFTEGQEEIPEEYRSFTNEFMGVNNPFNDIDITNKIAVRKMAKDGVKRVQDFEQAVIKRYRDGKIKIPEMTKTESVASETGKVDIKNLKQAKATMLETLTKHFLGAKAR